MKNLILTFAVLFQVAAFSQKELKGIWDLQFMGSPEKVTFDIEKPSITINPPSQNGTTVNFATDDEELNEELNKTSYDFFQNCWIDLRKKKKFIQNDLVIVNGIFGNEESSGKYYLNSDQKEITFEYISSKNKKIYSTRTFKFEVIKDEQLILRSIENPDFHMKFLKRN
mgnify:CR=1 FL=1